MRILKNFSFDHIESVKNPIAIRECDPEWVEAYAAWISQKSPTKDVAWAEGVFMEYIDHYTIDIVENNQRNIRPCFDFNKRYSSPTVLI